MKLLLLLWIVVYVALIARNALMLIELFVCKRKLEDFIVVSSENSSFLWRNNGSNQELKRLLRCRPLISRYINRPVLSYEDTINTSIHKSKEIYCDILATIDTKRFELIRSLNPFNALKTIALFPIAALSWFGLRPNKTASLLISAAGWITTYLLGLFSDEIKEFIVSLLQNL